MRIVTEIPLEDHVAMLMISIYIMYFVVPT